jgi:hypothetical protein
MKNEIFIRNFAGQEIELFTGFMQKTESQDANGNVIIHEVPLAVRGFVIDIDDEGFIYLGDTLDGIVRAVKFGPGMIIEIVKETSEFDDILEDLPIPTNDRGN